MMAPAKLLYLTIGSEIKSVVPDGKNGYFVSGIAEDAAQLGKPEKEEALSLLNADEMYLSLFTIPPCRGIFLRLFCLSQTLSSYRRL